jgi:integrase
MSCLVRRANGIYYNVITVNGHRIWKSTGCKNKMLAFQKLNPPKDEPAPKAPSVPTLKEFKLPLFSYLRTNLAPSTVLLYESGFTELEKACGNLPLDQYNVMKIEEYKTKRIKKVSPVKVNIEFRCLRAAFNIAVNWELLKDNPFRKAKQLRMIKTRPVHFTPEEFKTLLAKVAEPWYRDILLFAISTMMRLGEIVNLKWSSIDMESRIIRIENTEGFHVKTYQPRVIPIGECAFQILSLRPRSSEFVFTFPNGRRLQRGYTSHKLKKYVRACNLREELHFHSLRHSGATWLVQNNIPIYNLQKILGHSRIEMTQVYSHLEADNLRSSMEKASSLAIGAA